MNVKFPEYTKTVSQNFQKQTKKTKMVLISASVLALALILFFLLSSKGTKPRTAAPKKAIVKENGLVIEFPDKSPGLDIIKAAAIGEGSEFVKLEAPARVIAITSPSVSSGGNIVLFESSDLNDIYVGYVRAKNKKARSLKNLARIQDMSKLKVATEKDLIEAETELATDKADFAEFEGKLRAVGLNPEELSLAGVKKAWIISDVPESQIQDLKQGNRVKVKFSSFPDEVWLGVAQAIGDNVDPMTRTAKLRIEVPNNKMELKPGMYGIVQFPEKTDSDTSVLPYTAIVTVEGKNYVFVETSKNIFRRREVILGVSTKDVVNILEGLQKGERVVIQGSILLKGLSFGF